MLTIQDAAKEILNKTDGNIIPKVGCSYKNYWLIATYPKNSDPNENYPDGLIAVNKSDGSFATFDPVMDMEGFQQAIKKVVKL